MEVYRPYEQLTCARSYDFYVTFVFAMCAVAWNYSGRQPVPSQFAAVPLGSQAMAVAGDSTPAANPQQQAVAAAMNLASDSPLKRPRARPFGTAAFGHSTSAAMPPTWHGEDADGMDLDEDEKQCVPGIGTAMSCPSQVSDIEDMAQRVTVRPLGTLPPIVPCLHPFTKDLIAGKIYRWCACGRSVTIKLTVLSCQHRRADLGTSRGVTIVTSQTTPSQSASRSIIRTSICSAAASTVPGHPSATALTFDHEKVTRSRDARIRRTQ